MLNGDKFNASDPVEFHNTVNQSFTLLIANQTSSALKYSTLTVNNFSTVALYILRSFIPDLSEKDCSVCLDSAAQLLELGKLGSRYIFPSCYARFELYRFWESPVAAQEMAPPVEAPPLTEAEEDSNSQEVRLIHLREGRIGKDYSYDALQGEKQMES
ncbi:hypothetical protein Ddye_019583 [Dipteronia dyeriana]|uniref:Gnk2-homologous domain-containing protein n=1 Tax=Dipteronia dyeriana TaxID=168575 RepID=A0AAD9WVS3_9ROSI|nr:hypothetical protein Ddye_019583 [Dipteronia dyeriana]